MNNRQNPREQYQAKMTITEGVEYERYVAEWLAHNPGKTRLDVPQLTVISRRPHRRPRRGRQRIPDPRPGHVRGRDAHPE